MMTGAVVSYRVTRLLFIFDNELHQTDLVKELRQMPAHLTNVIESMDGRSAETVKFSLHRSKQVVKYPYIADRFINSKVVILSPQCRLELAHCGQIITI